MAREHHPSDLISGGSEGRGARLFASVDFVPCAAMCSIILRSARAVCVVDYREEPEGSLWDINIWAVRGMSHGLVARAGIPRLFVHNPGLYRP